MKTLSRKIMTTGLSLSVAGTAFLEAQKPPNILFIMADDHTTQAISAYGGFLGEFMPTPNIDRIAREGVRMNHTFVTNSISSPSRASILTGQYSHKHGIYAIDEYFDRNHSTFVKTLRSAGYHTGIVGKWHLGSEPAGFDFYNVLPGQGNYHNPHLIRIGNWDKPTQYGGHSTDVITNEAINFLQQADRNQPFLLMTSFKAPHRPWQPAHRFKDLLNDVTIPYPDNMFDTYEGKGQYIQYLNMSLENMISNDFKGERIPRDISRDEQRKWAYQRFIKDYLRCVAGIDENIGRLLQYLDDNGLTENTIVIYTSDQGVFLGEHGWFDKRLMYEEALRMPMLIRYPREIPAGTVNNDMVLNIDFAPLLLDYAGIATPDYMQGRSFRNNLIGQTPHDWRKSMYYRYWMNNDVHHRAPAHYGIRTERYKLIFYYAQPLGKNGSFESSLTPEWELYDLQNDPSEMRNIYHDPANKELIKQLKKELLRLKEKYNDQDSRYPEMQAIVEKYW